MCTPEKPAKTVCTEHCNINHNDPFPSENHPAQVPSKEVGEPEPTNACADQDTALLPDSFLSRLFSLPIIQDSVEIVEFYANKTSLSKYALEQTKTTFDQAIFISSQFASKYQYQMDRVDQLGCRSLDVLEDKVPMVRQHPSEVLNEVKATPEKLYNGTKDKLTSTVSRPITFATDNLEFLIDKYLPEREGNNIVIDESTMTGKARLYSLANQVIRRMAYRLEFAYSRADLYQLVETNKLLSNISQSITDTYHKLFEIMEAFKGEIQTKSSKRIDDWTSNLIHYLDKAAHYLKLHLVYLGPIQPLVNPLADFATHEYEIIRGEALNSELGPVQKATNIMHLTKEYIIPMIQGSTNCIQKQIDQSKVYHNNTADTPAYNMKSGDDVKTQAENKEKQNQ